MPPRNGSQCVKFNTRVRITEKGRTEHIEKPIDEIKCLFKFIRDSTGVRYEMNLDEYNQFEHKIVTLGLVRGKKFPPLFMYDYEFDTDKEFPEPLYEIVVDGPAEHPGPYTLIATQWHPILRHPDSVTFASLLEEHSPVHLFSGKGFVRQVRKVRQDRVVGLALCDPDLAGLGDPPYTENDLGKLLDTLNSGASMWADFGLETKENVIFTESIATGTLTFQYRLKESLTLNGLELPPDP